MLQYKKRII